MSAPIGASDRVLDVLRGLSRGVRHAARDPRAGDLAAVGPRTAMFLAGVWARNHRGDVDAVASAAARLSPGLAAQVFLDHVVIAALKDPRLLPRRDDYRTAADEVAHAFDLYRREGWLDDPASYHGDPPSPERRVVNRRRALDVRYEHVRFRSGFEPRPSEPGYERWMSHEPNNTMHAWVLRHRGEPRPWVVCVHGFGMGVPFLDLRAFRAMRLYREGLNVVAPVLPLHGPRAHTGVRGEGFMTINLIDSVHGLAQSAWDVRRMIRWLRAEHRASQIGLFGISLGGYVAALVASLEPGLECVIAGIPFADLPSLYRRHTPPRIGHLARKSAVFGDAADAVHRVVSPLAMEPLVPADRRFIFAGLGDRMSTYGQARRLWIHWDRPAFACYGGGHVGFYWSGEVNRFVNDALTSSGLLPFRAPATIH